MLTWVKAGAVAGATIGLLWGVVVTLRYPAPLTLLIFTLIGALTGVVGGVLMAGVSRFIEPWLPRLVVATVLGGLLGFVLAKMLNYYVWPLALSGAVAGLMAALIAKSYP